MKPLLPGAMLLISISCNQNVYDNIYRQIIRQALSSPLSAKATFEKRNTAIENLRALCHGQISSYERPVPHREQASTHWD